MMANTPGAAYAQAEAEMIRRRARPADMRAAVAAALAAALCGEPLPAGAAAAGALIAGAVAAHAASFPPGGEPAYHNQHHQAEAALAMGWLCAEARRLALLDAPAAAAGVLAMAGHDLQHDGSVPPLGRLEARSAALTAALAAQAGLGPDIQDRIRRVILATDPARIAAGLDADDPLCRLAREADLFGSLTPELGWRLSAALDRELRAAQSVPAPPPGSFAGRLRLLRMHRAFTPAARNLGMEASVCAQRAALARLGEGDPEVGAARLDALAPARARADYRAALTAAGA